MARKDFLSAQSIPLLGDGVFGKQIDSEILRIYSDIDDRGNDGVTRKLVIQLDFKPAGEGRMSIIPKVQAKLPANQGYPTVAKIDVLSGGIAFRADSPDNPDQTTINDQIHPEQE